MPREIYDQVPGTERRKRRNCGKRLAEALMRHRTLKG